jgi:hypothetical protein
MFTLIGGASSPESLSVSACASCSSHQRHQAAGSGQRAAGIRQQSITSLVASHCMLACQAATWLGSLPRCSDHHSVAYAYAYAYAYA